jgi:hypothetical protein
MANYHSPTVVQQDIPLSDMTELERLILCEIFETATVGDSLYFTIYDGPNSIIWIDKANLHAAIDDPRAKDSAALVEILDQCSDALLGDDDDIEIDTSCGLWDVIFQDIVRRSDALDYVSVMTSFTCDKMRPDGFGGMATLITAQKIRGQSTEEIMAEFIAEAVDAGEIKPEPGTDLQAESATDLMKQRRAQEIRTSMKRLHELGCAVVIFTPDELGEATPIGKFESHLIEQAWPFIEAYKDNEDAGETPPI